jgi:hypothetical protein
VKILYPAQQRAKDTLVSALKTHGAALDASATGLGKTCVACHVTAELGRPVAVIAPKIVLPSWQRELAETGIDPVFVLNFEKIRNGSTEWLGRRNKRMYDWRLPADTILIIDECHKCKGERSQNAALPLGHGSLRGPRHACPRVRPWSPQRPGAEARVPFVRHLAPEERGLAGSVAELEAGAGEVLEGDPRRDLRG